MESQFKLQYNGQEVETDDLNLVAEDAALADDRVLAELFRLAPYDAVSNPTITKALLTYAGGALVQPNGATGTVRLYPCRPMVASGTAATTDALDNLRDIRSAVFIGNATAAYQQLGFANNTDPTNPRWDLVYLRIDRDAADTTVTRYVKSAGPPEVETPTAVAVTYSTKVVAGVVTGTPSGTPALPSLPADSGGSYYVPIAYVRIQNSFVGTTIITPQDIFDVAPVIAFSSVTGATTVRPANGMNKATGAVLSKAIGGVVDWGFTSSRPDVFMPPSMVGEEVLYVALDLESATTSAWSQPDGSILDDSRDWRNRVFTFHAYMNSSSIVKWAFGYLTSTSDAVVPSWSSGASLNNSSTADSVIGMGQSLALEGGTYYTVAVLNHNNAGAKIPSGQTITVYVDATSGALKFTTGGTLPRVKLFMRLTASAPFYNCK